MNLFKVISALIFSCLIGPIQSNAMVREGIYIGAGCGATFDSYRFTARNITTGFTVKKNLHKTHSLGTAFLGYGYTLPQCFYIAAEAGTTFPSRSVKFNRPGVSLTNFTFNNHLTIQDYVYADLLPGYRLSCDWLIYGRIGVSYAHERLVLEENPAAGVARYSFSKNRCALRLGVGLNYSISECVGVGIDYCFTDYRKQRTHIDLYTLDQIQRPQAHYVGISVIFNFPR